MGIALSIQSDTTVTDGARMFFGNTQAVIYRISRTIPAAVVADLITRGRDVRAARAPSGGLLPVLSARQFAGPELIKVAGGELVRFDELDLGVRVHCPHHDDGDPSAFTLRFRNGQIGIHCSACKVTFGSNSRSDDYDFNAFDRLFEELQAGQQEIDPDASGLDRFFPPASLRAVSGALSASPGLRAGYHAGEEPEGLREDGSPAVHAQPDPGGSISWRHTAQGLAKIGATDRPSAVAPSRGCRQIRVLLLPRYGRGSGRPVAYARGHLGQSAKV
jgi:hypothetical protein